MHGHKTGALIVAAVRLGGLVAVAEDDPRLTALTRYARAIGLAFQIHDDILDVTGDTVTLGKTSGADAARAKPTYPSLLGLEGAQRKAHSLIDEAVAVGQRGVSSLFDVEFASVVREGAPPPSSRPRTCSA